MCRRASSSPSTWTSRTASTARTSPVSSMRFSTRWPARRAPASWRRRLRGRASGKDRAGEGGRPMSANGRPGEDSLIARFFAPIAGEGALNLMDDAACLTPKPGHDLVLTADALVEGVHFLPEDAPGSIARKALGVNVSDLAAKGAEPSGFLLSLALPDDWSESWLSDFAAGLGEASRDFACPLLGGDTVRARGPLTLSVTAVGQVPTGRMVLRTTAQAGDVICVTGTIGDAALGLKLRSKPGWTENLSPDEKAHLSDRYLHPQPRHRLAAALRSHASAAMDVSDGLAGDLAKMMQASGVGATS